MSAAANIWLATSNGFFFTDALTDDVVLYPGLSSQRILLGTSNTTSRLAITSNFVYTNSNLGIMTSNPQYALDVNGDLNFSGTLRQGGSSLVGSQWSNSGAVVFLLNSNVGIGTSNPSSRLGVDGNIVVRNSGDTLQTQMSIQGNNTSNTYLLQVGGTANASISNALVIYDSNATVNSIVTVWKDGNVGIGTTTPASKLDVNGNILIKTTSEPGLALINSNNAQQCVVGMATAAAQYSSSALSNDLIIRAENATARVHLQSGTGAAGLTINSNNNIGVGTSTPIYPFQVNTTSYTTAMLGSNFPVCLIANDPIVGFNLCFTSNYQSPQYSPSGYCGGMWFQTSTGAMHFMSTIAAVNANSNVNGLPTRMTIAATGYVGIGCNLPSFVLDVKGNTQYNSLAQFTSCNVCLMISTGDTSGRYNALVKTGDALLVSASNYGTDSAGMVLGPWTSASKGIRIDAGGNVGIGLNTPAAKMHVSGDLWANTLLALSDGTCNVPAFSWSNDTNTGMFHPAQDQLAFSVAGSNMLFMTSSNIGIGTLTPSNKLDVAGRVSANTFYCHSNLGVAAPATGWYGGSGDRVILWPGNTGVYPYSIGMNAGTMWQSVPFGTQHQWYINGDVGMTFSNYMLGISVLNPSFALDVMGSNVNAYNIAQFGSTCNASLMVAYGDVATRYSDIVTQGDIALIPSSNSQQSTSGLVLGPWTSASIHKGIRIDGPTGNVGIGLSNPATTLHVSGDACVNTLVASNAKVAGSYMPNLTSNLLAYYPFDGNANDAASNFNLSAAGYVSYKNVGKVNNAITFNNPMISTTLETSYVENTTIASTITGPPITVACWFNIASNVVNNTQPTIFLLGCNMTTPYIEANLNPGNVLIVGTLTSNSGGLQWPVLSGTIVTSNIWYHIGITYDNTNIRTYLNGSQINSTALTGNFMNTGAPRLRIGGGVGWSTSNGHGWYGSIDDFRVYNRVLSATEISALYQSNMATSMVAFGSNTNTSNFVGVCMPNPQQALDVAGNIQCTGNIAAGNLGMFRNRVINGDMRIAQRGTSSNIGTGPGSSYVVDRWRLDSSITTGGLQLAKQTLTSNDAPYQYGLKNSLKLTASAANSSFGYIVLCQVIEGTNVTDLNWGTPYGNPITVSAWLRTNLQAGSVTNINIRKMPGATHSYVSPITLQGSNIWQFVSITIPPPPVASGIWSMDSNAWGEIDFGMYESLNATSSINTWIAGNKNMSTTTTNIWATQSNFFEFTGIQFEKGNLLTPFEFLPYNIELALCQRYYEVVTTLGGAYSMGWGNGGWASTNLFFPFRQVKRATPVLASGSVTGSGASGGVTLSNEFTTDQAGFMLTTATTQSFYYTVTAPLAFSAEY